MARYIYEWKQTEHGRRLFRRPNPRAAAPTVVAVEPETETAAEPPVNYAAMKKDELVEAADAAGVDSSGTKADIIERLEQSE